MAETIDFRVLELLCGRLCHELVSPVGAINNGVELLDEEDPEFVKEAMALIAQSARTAGRRLQFYRFAYGTAGGGSLGGGREVAQGLLEGSKVRCVWAAGADTLPTGWQKLACNLLVLAAELLPRGGVVTVAARGESGIEVTAEGEAVNPTDELQASLRAEEPSGLTARTVQAFYTARLALDLGARLSLTRGNGGRAILTAEPGNRVQT